MRSSVFLCFALFSLSLFAQVDQVLPGQQLAYYGDSFYGNKITKASLFKILDQNHTIVPGKPDSIATACTGPNCYRHSSVGYDNARAILFGQLFLQRDNRGNFVVEVYCRKPIYFRQVSDISNMSTEVNIEHTWPQSKFNGNFDKMMQKSDMHHLYPADSDANNRRANNDFGDVGNSVDELNVHNCSSSKLSDINGQMLFSPPVEHRGNVARSLFYFATRYNMTIGPAEEMILKIWNKMDPVDQAEVMRHAVIAKYQKVRNPFVDFPSLVDVIQDF